jgi:hypothetical protein
MTNYFVRISGSDGAAGTTAGAAWRTIGKALGASGIASGDTVYVGAGVYREAVTVAMTSAVAETIVHGDVTGEFTGDSGEVIWTNFVSGWNDTPSGDVLNLSNRDFLTLRNFTMIAGAGGNVIDGGTAHSSNITIDNCMIQGFGSVAPIVVTASFATALAWTIKNSFVCVWTGQNAIAITETTGTGADWDLNVQIQDSVIIAMAAGISVTNSGTSANEGGGVDLNRCTIIAGTSGFLTVGTRVSLTFPCTVTDCLILSGTNSAGLNAGEAGAITDLGGNVLTAGHTNTTAHATTRTSTEDFPAQLLSLGHEWMWGMQPRRAFAPMLPAVFSRGHIGSTNTDMEGRVRPEGTGLYITGGTATAGAATTMTDGGAAWSTNEHVGRLVRITGNTGSGQVKHISSNTATVLTIGGLSGDWSTTPDNTSTYIIYEGPPAETDKATSGSTTTFVVSGAAWSVNKWAGYSLEITAGAQSGNTRTISSNTSTTLTTAAFGGAIDNTSVGSIYWPGASLTANGDHPGAFEHHDHAQKETTTTDAGSVGIVIEGPGSHEFLIPVDASATVITVRVRYDADHGTTNKPQAILRANGEIGVTTETVTAAGAAGSFETLTFASQTPSAKGVVTVRLVSRSDTPYGRAYFDTWTVS